MNTDNLSLFVIYGITPSTAETQRFYVSAATGERALHNFWTANARDFNHSQYEWVVNVFVEGSDTNDA